MRMRSILAVLVVLLAPTLASAQLSLGPRTGYAIAMGEAAEGEDLADLINGQIPFQFDIGYRVTPAITVGGYVSAAVGVLGENFEDFCDEDGVECGAALLRLGLQVDYRFLGGSATPWIGAGIGYEWLRIRIDNNGSRSELKLHGAELLNLQGGVEWKLGGPFSLGPFAMLSIARYSAAEIDGDGEDLDDKGLHQWLELGVRGRFDL